MAPYSASLTASELPSICASQSYRNQCPGAESNHRHEDFQSAIHLSQGHVFTSFCPAGEWAGSKWVTEACTRMGSAGPEAPLGTRRQSRGLKMLVARHGLDLA